MCKGRPSLPTASDSPSSLVNSENPQMNSHLIVDIVTLCIVVAIALLFLALRAWQRKKAAAAAAAAAAALSVQSEGTQTDNPVFNIDDTINRLSLELSTHQQRLDSIEQGRLEMVTINRLLSFLPKSAYSKEEDGFSDQDIATSHDQCYGSWGSNRNQYPAV